MDKLSGKDVKTTVIEILAKDKGARNNDLRLYALFLKKKGLPTDLVELSKMGGTNILETIRRTRQKAQEVNPLLDADGPVRRKRESNRKHYKDIARDL